MSTPFTVLLDWVEGRLDADRAAEVTRAVQLDPRSQDTVRWIREFLDVARHDRLTEPPEDLKTSLRSLFSSVHGTDAPTAEGSLALDTRGARVMGMRGPDATAEAVDHLVLEAEGLRITLTLMPGRGDSVDVRGVVETADGHPVTVPAEVVLATTGRAARVTRASVDGSFVLSAVSRDVDALWYLGEGRRFRCALSLREP